MKANLVYKMARGFGQLTQKLMYPVQYHGLEQFRKITGPYILICNHLSWRDVLTLMVAANQHPIYFIAKKELFKNKFLAYLFNQAYVIPIQRQSADLGAIRKALATVKQGNVLGIFPEGSRYYGGDMQQAESGIALLAAMAKVPVIPCYIDRKMEKFNKANVYFFEPLQYQDITGANFNEQFMQRLKSFYADVVKMH